MAQAGGEIAFADGFESGLCGWSDVIGLEVDVTSLSFDTGSLGTAIRLDGVHLADPGFRVFLRGPASGTSSWIALDVTERQEGQLLARLDDPLQPGTYDVVLDACWKKRVLADAFSTPVFAPGFAAPEGRVVMTGTSFGAQPGSIRIDDENGPLPATILQWKDDEVVFAVSPEHIVTGRRSVHITSQEGELTVREALSITSADPDDEGPRLVSAVATSNTSVLAQFNEAVLGGSAGAGDPSRYSITAPVRTPGLAVVAAEVLPPDYSTVLLTTLSQSDLAYTLIVSGIHDLAGNPLSSPDIRIDPRRADFQGVPASGDQHTDLDGDGLSDAAEQLGWTVTVVHPDGSSSSSNVTSDPLVADTDGDSLTDLEEAVLRTNPRKADTDVDSLADFQEWSEVFSSPNVADTDGDGLHDGSEFNFFGTSPLLVDTDGDQLPDGDEVVLQSRNARVADLPEPSIEVGDVDLQLDVRFTATSTEGTRELESTSVSKVLTQSEDRTFSNTFSTTQKVTASLSVTNGWELSTMRVGFDSKVNFAVGYAGEWTSSFTNSSSQSAQEEVARSFTTDAEVTESETVQREIVGASMRVPVTLKALGGIAFTISNLEISALIQDPRNPAELRPVATLLPESGDDLSINLGPFNSERGPFVFRSVEVYPALVQDLLIDPRGLVFQIANFDITDEAGRNFAFTSQEINERTAPVVIDFGGADQDGDGEGDGTERYFVATSGGRVAIDTNGDGEVDEGDRPVVFDRQGRAVGIDLIRALGDILGLEHRNEDVPGEATQDLTPAELANSFSTRAIDFTTGQPCGDTVEPTCVEQLWRVRSVSKELGNPLRDWVVLTPTGIDYSADFRSRLLEPESAVDLAFVQDLDGDRLPARWEFQSGCSDEQADTDGDGLLDRYEIFGALRDGNGDIVPLSLGGDPVWGIDVVGGGRYEAYASCRSTDSDLDGTTDLDELDRCVDSNGTMVRCCALPDPLAPCSMVDAGLARRSTDPKNRDTDLDGVPDPDEDQGYTIELRFPRNPASKCSAGLGVNEIVCVTDPLDRDSDGDTLMDGDEVRLGLDPTVDDGNDVLDPDGDGLVTREEIDGWSVRYTKKSTTAGAEGVVVDCTPTSPLPTTGDCATDATAQLGTGWSYEFARDTDGDGISDGEERQLGTHPRRRDTDGDGIFDLEEVVPGVDGFETDPLDADTDDDLRDDGVEVTTPQLVQLESAPFTVKTSPVVADEDNDLLVDGEEEVFGTDPTDSDTDGDAVSDGRETQTRAGQQSNPLVPDQVVTFTVTQIEIKGVCDDTTGGESLDLGDPEICATWRLRSDEGVQEELGQLGFWNGDRFNSTCPTRAPQTIDPGPAWSRTYVLKEGESVILNTVDSYEWDGINLEDPICEIGESSAECPPATSVNEFSYPVTSSLTEFSQTCLAVANGVGGESGEILRTHFDVEVVP